MQDEKTILIEKALGPENIDEIFAKSKEYRERESESQSQKILEVEAHDDKVITTRLIEAPPPASHKSISEAPRSVREWDNMAPIDRSPSPGSSISQSTRKHRRSQSAHQSVHESIHEDEHFSKHGSSVHESIHKSIHRDRSVSPATTHRTRRSRATSRARSRKTSHSSNDDATTIIEKKIIREDNIDESNTIDLNFPLNTALISSRSDTRTDADIRREIRELERERREIRRETDIVRYEGRASRRDTSPIGLLREPIPRGEIIIADRRDDAVVSVRKDKRGRMSLVV